MCRRRATDEEPASMTVAQFIERNLIGRTLTSSLISALINDGRTEVTYADQTFFSNFVRREQGFDFDLTVITLARRFGLYEGRRTELAGTMDVVRVYRYQMTERVSTGRLLGFARHISTTNTEFDPVAGTCFMVQMWVEDCTLVVDERQIGYGDFPVPGGGRKPQALDSTYRYSLDARGALQLRFDQATFDVDPDTFERTPSGDKFPTQVGLPVAPSADQLLGVPDPDQVREHLSPHGGHLPRVRAAPVRHHLHRREPGPGQQRLGACLGHHRPGHRQEIQDPLP